MKELNTFYTRLESKVIEIANDICVGFPLSWGWYNGHFHKDENEKWIREAFPIPVITIDGLCDIEININKITVSTKLSREKALEYHYERFKNAAFESYGIENYLLDFYTSDMVLDDLKDNILKSDENEIGFSFLFDFDEPIVNIKQMLHFIEKEGFYY